MFRSLRSRLIAASVLWTAGLLMALHILMMTVVHVMPRFRAGHLSAPLLIASAVMLAAVALVWFALRPLRGLRGLLAAVREGREDHVEGNYPSEVQPLVDDLNALLREREKAVQRALAAAGDLAHGLKTPLALLRQEAERAQAAGHTAIAGNIGEQVECMTRRIDYQLARARAAAAGASGNARCSAAESIHALVRTLSKLYPNRTIHVPHSIPEQLQFRVQREDFEEMLGNLLDNACKWAASEVQVHTDGASVIVDDDGTGLAPDLRASVLARGVRADETAPGSGLGLAIVRDLAELYGGSILLEESPQGGLRALLRLPISRQLS